MGNIVRNFLLATFMFTLTACASTSEQSKTEAISTTTNASVVSAPAAEAEAEESAADNERVVCRSEQIMGSNRKTKVCRKVASN
jgi:guanyl-specific ribonuclease Sa